MPFCTHCGAVTGMTDRFCAHCGRPDAAGAASQAPPLTPPPPAPMPGLSAPGAAAPTNIRPNVASMLCYMPSIGWIASVFFLTAEGYKQNRYVRFHALQALFLFIASMLLQTLFGLSRVTHRFLTDPFTAVSFSHWSFSSMIGVAVLVVQIVGMVKTVKSEPFHIPVLADLAERSMT